MIDNLNLDQQTGILKLGKELYTIEARLWSEVKFKWEYFNKKLLLVKSVLLLLTKSMIGDFVVLLWNELLHCSCIYRV